MYVPLDVNFPDDDRIADIGLAASGLYAQALCIAKRLGRDGLVPGVTLRRLLDDSHDTGPLDALVATDLIEGIDRDGHAQNDACAHAYRICAWHKHNRSDGLTSSKGQQMAHQRHHVKTGNPNPSCPLCFPQDAQVDAEKCADAMPDASETHMPTHAGPHMQEVEVEVEVEVENTRASHPSQALAVVPDGAPSPTTLDQKFEAFWEDYPEKNRTGKIKARAAWDKARKHASPEAIHESLRAHLVPWSTFDKQFIPGAGKWLNEGRFLGDPPPPRTAGKPNRVDDNMARIEASRRRMGAS